MARARLRQRPWPSAFEQERMQRHPADFSHLTAGRPCLWRGADRWRDGLLLEVNGAGHCLVVGQHYGGEVRSTVITDGRNVQQPWRIK